jgi:O-antigen/teichoic acid export membrane protein
VASAGTTLIALALIARYAGPEVVGAVGIGLAIGSIAAASADFGTSVVAIRGAARRPEDAGELLGMGLVIRLATVPVALGLAWLAVQVVIPGFASVAFLAAAGLVAQQTAELTRALLIARGQTLAAGIYGVLENLLWLAVLAAALAAGATADTAFLVGLGAWLASLAMGLLLLWRLLAIVPRWAGIGALRRTVRSARPIAAALIVGMTTARLDPVLIGLLAPTAGLIAAGSFFAASRLIAAFDYLPDTASRAAYPDLSRLAERGDGSVVPLLRRTTRALLLLGAAVPVVLIPAGAWLMTALFGDAAGPVPGILGLLAIAVPIRYVAALYGVTLVSGDVPGRRLIAGLAGLACVLLVDIVGIPLFGLPAAVAATLGAASIALGLYATFVRRRFGAVGLVAADVLPIAAAASIGIAVGLVAGSVLPPPLAAAVAAVSYGLAVWVGRSVARRVARSDR